MAEEDISQEMDEFLREHIENYAGLVILFWLVEHAASDWAAEAIAAAVGIPEQDAQRVVESLAARGLLSRKDEQPPLFRYVLGADGLGAKVRRLQEEYKTKQLQVMRTMNENALTRVRVAAARAFADSFRLRGPKDRG